MALIFLSSVPTIKGDTAMILEASRENRIIQAKVVGESKSWSMLLRNISSVKSVEGGFAIKDEQGMKIIPREKASSLTITL